MGLYDQYHVFAPKPKGSLPKRMSLTAKMKLKKMHWVTLALSLFYWPQNCGMRLTIAAFCYTYDLTHKIPFPAVVILHSKNLKLFIYEETTGLRHIRFGYRCLWRQ